jgi:glycosyltransferase involved in cell wall biosynthesis
VFPSLAEGFGFPPLEAMACGTPVVASNATSLRENLTGAAELVPPGDVDALAAAIERLVDDEAARTDLAARGTAHAHRYTSAEFGRRMARNYEELGGRRVSKRSG